MKQLYLTIDILIVVFPILLSFDKKVHFVKRWKYLFPSIFVSMIIFIPWDVAFTWFGVWGFNKQYLTDLYFFNLPVEEVLFFIVVPYACVFTYDVLMHYNVKNFLKSVEIPISVFLVIGLLFFGFANNDKLYTLVTFNISAILILLNQFVFKLFPLSFFYQSYCVMLLPFLIVNSVLTGSFIENEIVWYNDSENLGMRIFTIPFEDIFYGFSLILLNLTIYSALQRITYKTTKPVYIREPHI